MSEGSISRVFNFMIEYMYERFNHIFKWDEARMDQAKLSEYALAINAKGAPLTNTVGFIDGTVRGTCRPGVNQRVAYNGHKVYIFIPY